MPNRADVAWAVAFGLAATIAVTTRAQSRAAEVQPLPPQIAGDQAAAAGGDETPQLWFVELASPPTADGSSAAQVKREKANFRAAAATAHLNYSERYAFDTLWNGLSVRVAKSQLSALSHVAGVKAIYPVVPITHEQDRSANGPDLFTSVPMIGADIVQNTLGYTGAGVHVAVIDTGIDYGHPDLGGCFGPSCRVAKGYDFVGDAYDAGGSGAALVPHPDPDPMDCAGHGTHVSGIIGAKAAEAGGVTGVAPGVTFYAYRVFGCSGSTDADVMIAAMERALGDGADVVNMSIGSAGQWPEYPTAQASTRLVNKGVSVVASAGNDGASGLYFTGAPAVGSKVISVASYDNVGVRLPYFTASGTTHQFGYIGATGAPATPTSGGAPLARTGTPTSTADGCSALPAGSMTGYIVLIRRGTCSFNAKAFNAQSAGAVGVVLYNNTSGFISPTVAGPPAITIPVVAVTAADGVLLNGLIAAGPTTMTWTDQLASFPNPTGGLISSFSSYGLSPDLTLKPDIGAPGGNIYSTFPLNLGGYANLSGTSMSSPHVAGAVALLLQAKPHTPSNAVRDILQNSAEPKAWWGNPGLGYLDNVQRQGAGMLRIDRAIEATTRVEPGKLSLGDSSAGPVSRTLTIQNSGSSGVTYSLTNVSALATGANTFTPSFFVAPASVAFSPATVSIPAGGSATVNVTITAPPSPDRGLYGGYVVVTPTEGQVVRVPYSGFIGDYQSIQVLTPTANGFPWLAQVVGASYTNRPSGATYTMQGNDVPFILAHFDHQSRLLSAAVQDANTGKSWHTAFAYPYLGRNSTATSFYALPWDGTTVAGNKAYLVPNGQYKIVLTLVKALGDANNPADVETWTSPVITIAR
jgi:minor extracellular serine protease Vpr